MPATRRETSAETAQRFLATAMPRLERAAERRRRAQVRARATKRRRLERQLSRLPAALPEARAPRRIAVDFAEPTLRLIHDVLLDALHAGIDFSDRSALLLIAEQMVATALGMPPCDDPPLTDREVG